MHLPPSSVLWVKVFVELQDELDQWTDLDNPPGMWEGEREGEISSEQPCEQWQAAALSTGLGHLVHLQGNCLTFEILHIS